jgi:hypothetical protein
MPFGAMREDRTSQIPRFPGLVPHHPGMTVP